MMKPFTALVSVVLLTFQLVHALNYPQYFQAFDHNHCIGTSTDFLETTNNLTDYPAVQAAKSASARGIWRLKFGGLIMTTGFSHYGKTCSLNLDENTRPEWALRLLPGDLDDSILGLYSSKELYGWAQIVTTEEKSFDQGIAASSWVFTGPNNFTLYAGKDFTGNSTCLTPNSETQNLGWGATYDFALAETITVWSVKIGCDSKATSIVTGKVLDKPYIIQKNVGEDKLQVEMVDKIKFY